MQREYDIYNRKSSQLWFEPLESYTDEELRELHYRLVNGAIPLAIWYQIHPEKILFKDWIEMVKERIRIRLGLEV
jgi:hypothetical protein